jgi:hypothetical protein
LEELKVFAKGLGDLTKEEVEEVIGSCGSFLTLQNSLISFVHQSAKDYLLNEASNEILPFGIAHQHHMVFSRSLELLYKALSRDIYGLQTPGHTIDQVSTPEPDPLAPIGYSCVFWVDHLANSGLRTELSDKKWGGGSSLRTFFEQKYLQWLEALSLLRCIPAGVKAVEKLKIILVSSFCTMRRALQRKE